MFGIPPYLIRDIVHSFSIIFHISHSIIIGQTFKVGGIPPETLLFSCVLSLPFRILKCVYLMKIYFALS